MMILWLTRSVWEFTSLTRLASTSTQTISKGLFDLAVRNFKRNHAPRLRYRAQASPLLRDAEVVRPVHEHVYAIELLAEKRPELKERLPVVTGREPPSPRAGRYAGHQQNGERARDMRTYVKRQDTVLDTVDDLLRVEKELRRAT